MDSFFTACKVVVPLIIYMGIGCAVRTGGILTRDQMRAFNVLVFKVLLPISLFFNVYQVNLADAVDPLLFLSCFFGMILFSIMTWLLSGMIAETPADRATITQGAFRSNYVLYGGSIAAVLCSEAGNAVIAALTAIIVPTINILSVIYFEKARGGKLNIRRTLTEILKNPLVIGGFAGLLGSAVGLKLPEMLSFPLKQLTGATTPLALVMLGGILAVNSLKKHKTMLLYAVFMRLLCIPLTAVIISVLLGMRGDQLVAVIAVFASPTAVASAPMAQVMGGNGDLAGEIVATTTIVSIVTIFAFVYVLSAYRLI
ncbi:MAG: AEC family transporter [Lachnospiraceae bacterium]|nr:AEC family transporter [Lachnospiraceae bacterium]